MTPLQEELPLMFSVTISEKGGQQSQYDFSKPEITIGRMKGNDIVLPKGNVSKQHTRIFLRGENFFIVDLKSTNGTYVNGRKVTEEQSIDETDKIFIGDFILQLQQQGGQQRQPGPSQPQPPRPPGAPGGPGGPTMGGGNPSGGGRHFPTVMDGTEGDLGRTGGGLGGPAQGLGPGAGLGGGSANRSKTDHPQRSKSAAGAPNPGPTNPGGPPSPGPSPSAGGGLGAGLGGANAAGPGAPNGRQQQKTPVPGESNVPDPGAYSEDPPEIDVVAEIEPVEEITSDADGPTNHSRPNELSSAPAPSLSPPAPPQPSTPAAPSIDSGPAPGSNLRETSPPEELRVTGSALVSDEPMADEFDPDLHRAQQDVAKVFFEATKLSDLPTDFPLDNTAVEQRLTRAVKKAVDTVGPDADRDRVTHTLTREALGLGPIESYLEDDKIRSIYVNSHDRIILLREGNHVIADQAFSHPDFLTMAARRLLGGGDDVPASGQVRLEDGTDVHILMPPLAVQGPVLTIRKPNNYFPTLRELANSGVMTLGMAEFLERSVEAGRSILIAGPNNSGKSTMLSALMEVVPESARIISVEQHSNLPLQNRNLIRLEASPASGYDMRFLVQNAVAMHPDRILVDECHGAEAYEWVTAATAGTQGSMLTLHGASAIDALRRLQSMCLLAAAETSPRGLREQIARSVDLVVIVNTTADSRFRIQQIAEVQGVDLDAYRINDIFYYRVEGTAGAFHPTGYIPLFYEDLRHAGFEVDLSIFRD